MDRQDAAAIVKKMKDGARASPWVPFGAPPRERYHHLPNGLSLCFTLDVLPKEHVDRLARIAGVKLPEELVEGGPILASEHRPSGGLRSRAGGKGVLALGLLRGGADH